MKRRFATAGAALALSALMAAPAAAYDGQYKDLQELEKSRDVVIDVVGTGSGLGCAAVAAGLGAATGPLGVFTGPLIGVLCATIVSSTTATIMNCAETGERYRKFKSDVTGEPDPGCLELRVPLVKKSF